MQSPNYVAVLAILNVMLHHIAKRMPPIDSANGEIVKPQGSPIGITPNPMTTTG